MQIYQFNFNPIYLAYFSSLKLTCIAFQFSNHNQDKLVHPHTLFREKGQWIYYQLNKGKTEKFPRLMCPTYRFK